MLTLETGSANTTLSSFHIRLLQSRLLRLPNWSFCNRNPKQSTNLWASASLSAIEMLFDRFRNVRKIVWFLLLVEIDCSQFLWSRTQARDSICLGKGALEQTLALWKLLSMILFWATLLAITHKNKSMSKRKGVWTVASCQVVVVQYNGHDNNVLILQVVIKTR